MNKGIGGCFGANRGADMSVSSHLCLNDGNRIPVIGFGTYAPTMYPRRTVEEATDLAIKVGYRHIDGAYLHENEAEVGRAIRKNIADKTISREDLFYTGKAGDTLLPVNEDGHYLYSNTDIRETWKAMERCKDAGLVKSIGVSNFNHWQLDRILKKPGLKHRPVCNQVECHLYLNQEKLLRYCKENGIVLVAYSALGSSRDATWRIGEGCPVLLEDPVLNDIASKIKRTPAQVALRYLLQRGIVVLAKSFTKDRIQENMRVFDFELGEEDMTSLYARNKNMRYDRRPMWEDHPKYPFHDEY
ncbi:aldo-keto reductase family 1 member C15-like isoform X2 [Lithobates pipiens]